MRQCRGTIFEKLRLSSTKPKIRSADIHRISEFSGYPPEIIPWIFGGYKLIEYRVLLSDLITQNRIVGWRISTGNPEFAGKLGNQIRISLFPGNPVDFYYPDIRIFCGNRQISALRIPCFMLWFASTNPDIRNFSGNRKMCQKSGFFSENCG